MNGVCLQPDPSRSFNALYTKCDRGAPFARLLPLQKICNDTGGLSRAFLSQSKMLPGGVESCVARGKECICEISAMCKNVVMHHFSAKYLHYKQLLEVIAPQQGILSGGRKIGKTQLLGVLNIF
ncbi:MULTISPECIES: hypothetical protein [unclassified Rhizobium]|uniref:hypothetical protein n=1 Tax=unclassified Rhizobium TaxID=2613769 RepID=UPI0012E18F16|nr:MULTISPECIES: hypothetical protein [unclassified Rhizobium]